MFGLISGEVNRKTKHPSRYIEGEKHAKPHREKHYQNDHKMHGQFPRNSSVWITQNAPEMYGNVYESIDESDCMEHKSLGRQISVTESIASKTSGCTQKSAIGDLKTRFASKEFLYQGKYYICYLLSSSSYQNVYFEFHYMYNSYC